MSDCGWERNLALAWLRVGIEPTGWMVLGWGTGDVLVSWRSGIGYLEPQDLEVVRTKP